MEHHYSRDSFHCHPHANRRAGRAWHAAYYDALSRRGMRVVAVALMAVVIVPLAYGQDDSGGEALRQVALAIERNYSSMQTWQLSAERFSESYNSAAPSTDDQLLRGRTTQRMSFFGDRVHGLYRSDVYGPKANISATEVYGNVDPPAASSLTEDFVPFWRTLLKAEGEVFRYYGRQGEEQYGQLVIEQETNVTRRPDYFDPMVCTGFEGKTGNSFREWLSFVADNVGKQHDFGIQVRRENDSVTLRIEKRTEPVGSNTYTFDLSKGGNLVTYHSDTQNKLTEISVAYEQHGETWVPIEHVRKVVHRATDDDPGKRWITRTTLAKQRVNEPIDPLVFTVKGLGLLPGNTVVDRRYPSTPVVFEYSGEGGTPEQNLDQTVAMIAGRAGTQPPADQDPTPLAPKNEGERLTNSPAKPPGLSEVYTASGGTVTIIILIGILALAGVYAVWASRRKSSAVKT